MCNTLPPQLTPSPSRNHQNCNIQAIEGGVESCLKAGKSNCCTSSTLRFLFDGRDSGGSGIGGIVVMVVVVIALHW